MPFRIPLQSLALAVALAAATAVPLSASLHQGSRSTADAAEIFGTGKYGADKGGFEISWNISQEGDLYRYQYVFSNGQGKGVAQDISHVTLQVSAQFVFSDFAGIIKGSLKEGDLRTYKPTDPGKSNPNLPGEIYGAKFDPPAKSGGKQYVEFLSTRAPTWGDFYAKSGKEGGKGGAWTTVWNTGFGIAPPPASATGIITLAYIAVPDTKTVEVIPEPVFLQLGALTGMGGLALRRKLRTRR